MSSMEPLDFLQSIAGFFQAGKPGTSLNNIRLATVDPAYVASTFPGTLPKITFDGEETMSTKRYPVMAPYRPQPSDRVALVPVGATYLILGPVDYDTAGYFGGALSVAGALSVTGALTVGGVTPGAITRDVFTSGGTWTKPAGAKYVRAQVQGGGGAGGGAALTAASQVSAGAGGQGGAYAESIIAAGSLASTVAVTIGSGGTGVSGGTGNTGGTSSFGSHVSAAGGVGGITSVAFGTPFAVSGPQAAQSMTGDIQIIGGGGGAGVRLGSIAGQVFGGQGGQSYFGCGSGSIAGGSVGYTGPAYGSGGGGSANDPSAAARSGGGGGAGIVIVTTYY